MLAAPDRPCPNHAICQKYLVGGVKFLERDTRFRNGQAMLAGRLDRYTPHDSGDTATVDFRGVYRAVLDQEHVAHRAFNDIALGIQHDAFPNRIVSPFGAGENLLQALHVFDTGQTRIDAQAVFAEPDLDADFP